MLYVCGVEDETVTHLFVECSYSTKLWEELQNALASKLNLPSVIPQSVILGIIDCQSSFVAINHLLLLDERYICIHVEWKQSRSLSGALNVFAERHKHREEDSS